jgi:putative transposase
MEQMARNAADETSGCLRQQLCASFRTIVATAGIEPLMLPPRSPNLNAFAERWVRSVKQECLSKLILFGEGSLKRALTEFAQHITANAITRGRATFFSFLLQTK